MDDQVWRNIEEAFRPVTSSPGVIQFTKRYKALCKESSVWTLATGCLIFTSWMLYYILFKSPEIRSALDIVVLIFFLLGAALYVISSNLFTRLNECYTGTRGGAGKNWPRHLETANRYLFTILSFLPGLYFAFRYEDFILRFYFMIYLVTSAYYLYKRYKDFEMEPFLVGLAMSVALLMVGPTIRGFFGMFGSGWFATSCASGVERTFNFALAVAFLLRLPKKYLPPNMLFGMRLIKRYFLYFLSWQTWFILMVVATWCNLGAGVLAAIDTYNNLEVGESNKPKPRDLEPTSSGIKSD